MLLRFPQATHFQRGDMSNGPTTPPPGSDRPAWEHRTQPVPTEPPPGRADTPASGKPWWKKGWGVAAIVLGIFVAIGAFADDGTDDAPDDEIAAAEDDAETVEEEAGEDGREAPEPDEAEEARDEVEEEAEEGLDEAVEEEEPEFEVDEETARSLIFPIVWDSAREGTRQIIADMRVIETVDLYDYAADSGTVVLDATPVFDFDSGVRDDAWEIMRIYAGALYNYPDAGNWVEPETGWAPTLDVTISTARYQCDGDTMQALGDARLSRTQWEEECRVN
jgi:hypothetical protein